MIRRKALAMAAVALLAIPLALLFLLHATTAAPPLPELAGDRALGDPSTWSSLGARKLDLVYDGIGGRESDADLMGFYADQTEKGLDLRVDLARPGFPRSQRPALDRPEASVYVLIDYAEGGLTALPDGIAGTAPLAWDRAVRFQRDATGALVTRLLGAPSSPSARGAALEPGESVRAAGYAERWDMAEASLDLGQGFRAAVARGAGVSPAGYAGVTRSAAESEATPIRYYVFSTVRGRVEDSLEASNVAQAPAGAHNVVFVQHGNQGLTYTTVFRGERGENASYAGDPNNPDDGYDELLAAHEYYGLPGNFHMASTLQTAAEWHDPTFNDWLVTGVTNGWAQMVSSAWAQHIMPFFTYNMNSWSVDRERDMTNWRYGGNAVTAWVPERVWLDNPDNDGNGVTASAGVIDWIGSSFTNNGVEAVILDDYIHCGYKNNATDDHHIYTLGTGLKVIPIDNNFVGEVNYDYGAAWNRIINSSADELIVYGNDWEIAAEVSQGAGNAFAVNNYIEILRRCSLNAGTVSVWRINDTLGGFGGGSIALQNGTYGLLGGYGGYGGSDNSWYSSWAGYTGPSNLNAKLPKWDYGTIWTSAYNKLIGVPVNNIQEGAWYVLMTNLHESGWHDAGEVSGWQHHYSNHIKNANVHSEAARWAAGLYANATGAYLSDVDDDGVDEAVIYNDRVMAVFESVGGRLQWMFAKGADYNYSVVSNDNVYWADTDGDYNETNHTAGLSDVSVGGADREHELYGLSVLSGSGGTVEIELTHAAVDKRVRLTLGDPYLEVDYNTFGDRAYVKSAFTPDLVDLTWNASLDRIWDPDGLSNNGGYFGFKNPRTNATGAVIVGGVNGVGGAGAAHNLEFQHTLLKGDEFYGDGAFQVYIFAGFTSAPDPQGHIPELKALRDQLLDTLGPDPVRASYYPTPNRLSLRFNTPVRYDNVVVTKIKIDANNDGAADLTLGAGDVVTSAVNGLVIDLQLSSTSATTLEALSHADLRLMLDAGAFTDVPGNPNVAVTNAHNKQVSYEAATKITIDGRIDPAEWHAGTLAVDDPDGDSGWGASNELKDLRMCWDDSYLYLTVHGQVSGNSWILYLDTDWNGPEGQTDLTAIDAWERGATFTAAGFRPDVEWGTYQHQGPFDGSSLFRLTSPTTTTNLSGLAVFGFDSQHLYGAESGSEIAIPWDALYGLGPGQCPANTQLALAASICWDPEPGGELGGDVAPDNPVGTSLPVVGACFKVKIDVDGNGIVDGSQYPSATPEAPRPPIGGPAVESVSPNPFNPVTRIVYTVAATGRSPDAPLPVILSIFDVRGREVARLVEGNAQPGRYEITWNGQSTDNRPLPSGLYFVRLTVDGVTAKAVKAMVK